MKRWIALLWTVVQMMAVIDLAAAHAAAAQRLPPEEQQALRASIAERYDVVPLVDGLVLRPKSRTGDVRLIEISDTIAVNGMPVTGRELRERVGADADAILRLSYLDADARREVFADPGVERPARPEPDSALEPERSPPESDVRRGRRSHGDRVRIFGDIAVREDEEIGGEVVAVLGSVRIDGEVGNQVVAVLGSVDLGPKAVVRGDVVAVGGRVRKAEGAQVRGSVTEVALGDPGIRVNVGPWMDGWGPIHLFGFGPVTRLLGSTFRYGLLALLACAALVIARRPVEGSALRVADNPVKAVLVGFAAWILFAPLLAASAIVLAISIVGIPLLLLLPFAVLALLLMALVGFSGTAYAVGQWTRRRFGIGTVPPVVDVCLGILTIMLPLLVGRVLALFGWTVSPIVYLLVAVGLAVEFLAWSGGLGAVLTNAFGRWQATRLRRATPQAPSATP
jgi:hypothetical protein